MERNAGAFIGPVMIVDLGQVDFVRSPDRSVVTARLGSQLLGASLVEPSCEDDLALFQLLEDIAAGSFLEIDDPAGPGRLRARVAWLNPFTSCVSVGPASDHLVFTDHRRLSFPSGCTYAWLGFDAQARKVLTVGDRQLPLAEPASMTEVSRALAAHW